MIVSFGYGGKILRVNLTNNEISEEDLNAPLVLQWVAFSRPPLIARACGLGATLGVGGDEENTRLRSLYSGVGAALVLLPILVGQAWARGDQFSTRAQGAPGIIDPRPSGV